MGTGLNDGSPITMTNSQNTHFHIISYVRQQIPLSVQTAFNSCLSLLVRYLKQHSSYYFDVCFDFEFEQHHNSRIEIVKTSDINFCKAYAKESQYTTVPAAVANLKGNIYIPLLLLPILYYDEHQTPGDNQNHCIVRDAPKHESYSSLCVHNRSSL